MSQYSHSGQWIDKFDLFIPEDSNINKDDIIGSNPNSLKPTDGEKNTARMMLEKGKVSLHQAYPTFDNLLFNKIAREIIIDNISVEDFVKNFKDEAQKAIDSEYER